MTQEATAHYKKLENMYMSALINQQVYQSITLKVSDKQAELALDVEPKYFHAGSAIHGSVYFKLLDDAAFFAASSIVTDVFIYTVSFNIQLLRPVTEGQIKAIGELKFESSSLFIADSSLYDNKGILVGRGSGNFMKSRMPLGDKLGYK